MLWQGLSLRCNENAVPFGACEPDAHGISDALMRSIRCVPMIGTMPAG